MALFAENPIVRPGQTLALESACGLPNGPLFLTVVSIGGVPVFHPVVDGRFGEYSWWEFDTTVPPELSNTSIELVVRGLNHFGDFEATDPVRIKFP